MTLVILDVPSDPFYPSPSDDGILKNFYKGTIFAPLRHHEKKREESIA